MKVPFRKIVVLALILLVVIQFVQPERNVSDKPSDANITQVYAVPESLHQTFVNKCYDCHSNNTHYPWYFYIQPIGWWLAAHIHDAKEELNFDDFKNYTADERAHKLEDIREVTEEGSMPLKAYVLFHPQAELTDAEKEAILTWVKNTSPN